MIREAKSRLTVAYSDWLNILWNEWDAPYMLEMDEYLEEKSKISRIYPDSFDIFKALAASPYSYTKVVILGQDPYHGPGQATGLAFGVQNNLDKKEYPPTLRNILKELKKDYGLDRDLEVSPSLFQWAIQGVLLLNTSLTVEQGRPGSHSKIGWEYFIEAIMQALAEKPEPVVYLLWGKHAQEYERFIPKHHHVIKSPHPSPFSAHTGFFFSKPFTKCNQILAQEGMGTIDWLAIDTNRRFG